MWGVPRPHRRWELIQIPSVTSVSHEHCSAGMPRAAAPVQVRKRLRRALPPPLPRAHSHPVCAQVLFPCHRALVVPQVSHDDCWHGIPAAAFSVALRPFRRVSLAPHHAAHALPPRIASTPMLTHPRLAAALRTCVRGVQNMSRRKGFVDRTRIAVNGGAGGTGANSYTRAWLRRVPAAIEGGSGSTDEPCLVQAFPARDQSPMEATAALAAMCICADRRSTAACGCPRATSTAGQAARDQVRAGRNSARVLGLRLTHGARQAPTRPASVGATLWWRCRWAPLCARSSRCARPALDIGARVQH